MRKLLSVKIPPEAEGRRLEWALKHLLKLSPREISQAKFRPGGICVNGEKSIVTKVICQGDLVEVCLEEETAGSDHLIATPGELAILYEDADVLAVNKPAGLGCHPAGGHYADTLANIMQYYFREKGERTVIRLVGRLDRETSGIVLAAKNQAAASRLNMQKKQGILRKEYLALVQGRPAPLSGWIEEPIGPRHSSGGIRMQVRADGKPARTFYETLGTKAPEASGTGEQKAGALKAGKVEAVGEEALETGEISLVRLRIDTGRTHQIRVHMAWLGYPLIGDVLYHPLWNGEGKDSWKKMEGKTPCDSRDGQPGAALHAVCLTFRQPFTGEEIRLETPVPEIYRGFPGVSCL